MVTVYLQQDMVIVKVILQQEVVVVEVNLQQDLVVVKPTTKTWWWSQVYPTAVAVFSLLHKFSDTTENVARSRTWWLL